MDYIHVDGFKVSGVHGHYPHERTREQEFEVSVRVGFDTHTAGESDKLTDTLDYDDIKKAIESTFRGTTHYLVEALAEDIAEEILKNPIAKEVTVTIKKVAVWDNGVPGVTITRS